MIHYTQADRAGAARYVFELVRHVARVSGDVTLICPEDFEFSLELRGCEGVDLRPVLPSTASARGRKFLLTARLGWQALCGACSVLKVRKSGRVVHVNFPGLMAFALPVLLLWRLVGKHVVLTVHDVVPHRWLFPRGTRWLEAALLRACYHTATHLVVHHSGAQRTLVEQFGIRPTKIGVIPHGAFSLEAEPLPLPSDGGGRAALIFGSLRENKGTHLAIAAVQQLRREGHRLTLTICGGVSGSERQYWQRCKDLIGLAPEGITVADRYVSNAELKEFIACSHFVLMPYTEFHSQSGVATLAMSNGRPVVATHAGGLADLVIPGKTGFVISKPKIEDVKEAIRAALVLNERELRLMAEQCATLFRTTYSWSAIASQYTALYRSTYTSALQSAMAPQ